MPVFNPGLWWSCLPHMIGYLYELNLLKCRSRVNFRFSHSYIFIILTSQLVGGYTNQGGASYSLWLPFVTSDLVVEFLMIKKKKLFKSFYARYCHSASVWRPLWKKAILSTVLKFMLLFQLVPHDQRTRNKSVIYFFSEPIWPSGCKAMRLFNFLYIMNNAAGTRWNTNTDSLLLFLWSSL